MIGQTRRFQSLILLGTAAILLPAISTSVRAEEAAKSEASASAPVAPIRWKDVHGAAYDLSLTAAKKATVFVFVSTQCPIANIYTPRINALIHDYAPRGVQFFVVDSNQEDSLAAVRRYAQERAFPCPVVKDDGTALADRVIADRTPEAVILDEKAVVRYRGRLDDNLDPDKVIRRDAREALDALLAGKPVSRPRTASLGCLIFRDTAKPIASTTSTVTFTRDVAPILFNNCVSCHRAGEAAPFSLETYRQARTWAVAIKDYTARHVMPPWKAVPGYGDFHDARVLTDRQIATLTAWADTGAKQGDPKYMPSLPHFVSAAGWSLGTPSVVLQPAGPYHLAADGKDVYRNYILPIEATQDRFFNAVAFKAGNRPIVHHMILFFDLSGKSVELDKAKTDGEPGYSVPGTDIGTPMNQTIWVAGWAPGNTVRFLPPGIAFKMPKGAKAVLQVHYHKDGKPEADVSQAALYEVKKETVDKTLTTGALVYPYLSIKPGLAHQEVSASVTLPADLHVWAVMPHMHMLGREIKMTATLPDGTKKEMIYINDWDFNWQETYRYKEPMALPKGTKIELSGVYDNSERNPRQPSHPPKLVGWGPQTTDEMFIGFFQLTVDQQHLLSKPTHPTPTSEKKTVANR